MEYKMSQLVALSDIPKSTILYYIREGLLPQAKKIKSNVHRYNDEHLELIKYIKYMKEEMGSSNEQIKIALQNKDQSFSSSSTMIAPLMQTLSAIPLNATHYTKDEFIEHFDLDNELLEKLLEHGILIPINDNDFTDKELSIINMIKDFEELGLEYDLIYSYIYHAKQVALLEEEIKVKLCDIRNDENFSRLWKIMFDALFNAKEYIFSRYTYKTLYKAIKDEIHT